MCLAITDPTIAMACDLPVDPGLYLATVHPSLKDHACVVPAGAHDPFAEYGVATLFDQEDPIMANPGPHSRPTWV